MLVDVEKHWARAVPSALDVVDTHTGGNPTRIVVGGLQIPADVLGVDGVRRWLRESADWVRTRLVHEPRGGGLTCAVIPLPLREEATIGAVILEPGSYPPMCGHCMIGLSVVVDEFGLLPDVAPVGGVLRFTLQTPAGPVGSEVRRREGRATEVTLTNVDSYLVDSWRERVEGRTVDVDLVWGGDHYPTVDADQLGLALEPDNASEITRVARLISAGVRARAARDPLTGEPLDVYQVMFHRALDGPGPTSRVVVVAPPGVIDRSPCGTGSSALLALKVARGDVAVGEDLVTRSIIGSTFSVRTETVSQRPGRSVVSPRLTGTAHVTGFSRVVADPADPLGDGFPPL